MARKERSLRRFLMLAGAAGCVILAVVQLASMAIYGDLANPPALPALLPPRVGLAIARRLGAPSAPVALRIAYAQALLHRGDIAAAQQAVAGLPDGIEAADLRGQLADAQRDPERALAQYARAGDFERAQRLIDDRLAQGGVAAAARFERELSDALTGSGQAAVRARALWRLGQITQVQADAEPSRRASLERAALDSYQAALAIAPNEETYLLAAAQQALTLGDKGLAIRYYSRALDAVPNSADARAGLERAR